MLTFSRCTTNRRRRRRRRRKRRRIVDVWLRVWRRYVVVGCAARHASAVWTAWTAASERGTRSAWRRVTEDAQKRLAAFPTCSYAGYPQRSRLHKERSEDGVRCSGLLGWFDHSHELHSMRETKGFQVGWRGCTSLPCAMLTMVLPRGRKKRELGNVGRYHPFTHTHLHNHRERSSKVRDS